MAIEPAAGPPNGALAFLFTDIAGSTARWERHADAMALAVARHDALLRAALEAHRGEIFKTVGDAFCVAFASPADAVAAAHAGQRALATEDWSAVDGLSVRMAVHVGEAERRDGDYFGRTLNRVARILGIGHGGQILLSEIAAHAVAPVLAAGVSLRDLGSHRLKDLEASERIFALTAGDLRDDFPRLRSLEEKPNNLPVQATAFVGRTSECAALRESFAGPAERRVRILSLVGFGGVGKTRLALQLAADVIDRFADGVWLVDLSPLENGDVVADEAARTIGAPASGGQTGTEAVIAALRGRETLLVFDGCEHVLPAVAALVAAVLRACPRVSVIATSRQALEIPGEAVHAVEAFAVPPPSVVTAQEAREYPSVRLFVERCVAATNRFALDDRNAAAVVEIVRRLDGIALALELAAPKVTVLTPRELSERLRDRMRVLSSGRRTHLPRQQTLRALIDWSFDLLDPDERALFRRLSVFAGEFTLEGAAALCAPDEFDAWRVLELCSALVAKSLVSANAGADAMRFGMLDSIREYAREKLADAGEATLVGARLTAWCATRLERLEPLVVAGDAAAWRDAFADDVDSVRGALEWAVMSENDLPGGRAILARLEWPHPATTPREAMRWFDAAEGAAGTFVSADEEARFFRHAARLGWVTGKSLVWRETRARRGIDAARRAGDRTAIARALSHLAGCLSDAGRHAEADAVFGEALAGDLPLGVETSILADRAINDLERGDFAIARERFGRVAELEEAGSAGRGIALLNVAELEFAAGNHAAARATGRAAREILEPLGAVPLALLACNLAAYALAADAYDEARTALHEALAHVSGAGSRWAITAIEHHAVYSGLTGAFERAALLLGFTEASYRETGHVRQRTERHGYERLASLLAERGAPADRARRAAGARLTLEQALSFSQEIHAATPIAHAVNEE